MEHRGMNVIASAFLSGPPTRSQRGDQDWTAILQLSDPTQIDVFVKVMVFSKDKSKLPICEQGDVIVCHGLAWSHEHQNFIGYKDRASFVTLPRALLLDDSNNIERPKLKAIGTGRVLSITPTEVAYARDLVRELQRRDDRKARSTKGDTPSFSRTCSERQEQPIAWALQEIKDMAAGVSCDAIVEVLAIRYKPKYDFASMPADRGVVICATDYTPNTNLAKYDRPTDGCLAGQQTLQISVFGKQVKPLASIRDSLDKGTPVVVHLRKLQLSKNGEGLLEGRVKDDSLSSTVQITSIDFTTRGVSKLWPDQVLALWTRRTAYDLNLEPQKLSPPDGEAVAAEALQESPVLDEQPIEQPVAKAPSPAQVVLDQIGSNSNRRDIARLAASGVLGEFLVKARVVDFFPDKLQDWIVAYCDGCGDRIPSGSNLCINHSKSSLSLRLHFFFGLADNSQENGRPSSLRVMIDEGARSLLFPDFKLTLKMRAGDETALDLLRERIGPLLGNLEQVKKDKKAQIEETNLGDLFDFSVEMVECEGGVEGPTTKAVIGAEMRFNKR